MPRAYSSAFDAALLSAARNAAGDLLGKVAQPEIFGARHDAGEIGRQPADRRRDRHVVVVEDDDQPIAERPGIVHRLIGHAGATSRRRRSPR
jgi:hypothetical protein